MLSIVDIQKIPSTLCIVKIDPYVPISFRSYSQPIGGARYIRFGDFKTQLLEMQFPPNSLIVSGFSLILGGCPAHEGLSGDGPSMTGLPLVNLPEGDVFSSTGGTPRLDIQTSVVLSCAGGYADISLDDRKMFDRIVEYGRVQFLLSGDTLVGLRVLNLTAKEESILHDYIMERLI